jgi:uncharacterized FAD-dependent dehydrogenase
MLISMSTYVLTTYNTNEQSMQVTGVQLVGGDLLQADAVVLAIGHSARPLYEKLIQSGVHLEPKVSSSASLQRCCVIAMLTASTTTSFV